MGQEYGWPFDSGSGGSIREAQWSEMMDLVYNTGVFRGQGNDLQVYADSTGMQVKVKDGKAWMKGHFYKHATPDQTLAITGSHATLDRIDRVVIKLDWTLNIIGYIVLTGTPAGSPEAPALTQTSAIWEISLAQILVDASVGTIAAGKVTDERNYADGENWIAPSLSNSWVNYGGSYSTAGYYKDPLGIVHIRGMVKDGTADTAVFTLPAGYRPEHLLVPRAVGIPNALGGNPGVEISTAGVVKPFSSSGINSSLNLENIHFRTYA